MARATRTRSRTRWLVAAGAVVVVLAIGGPFVYLTYLRATLPDGWR